MTTVLGVDPGSVVTGYALLAESGNQFTCVHSGQIALGAGDLTGRLTRLFRELTRILEVRRPQCVAVESAFHAKSVRSALVLGHARGVALLVAARATLPVHEYAPARVKRSVGAGGAGDKDAVGRMVHALLGLTESGRHDAADALAVAVCHLNHARFGKAHVARGAARRPSALAALAGRLSPSYQRFGAAR